MHPFFTEPRLSSDDIKLTDDEGFLINPFTGGNLFHHSGRLELEGFTTDYLNESRFLGTYFSCVPGGVSSGQTHQGATLSSGFLHAVKLRISRPMVMSSHHDFYQQYYHHIGHQNYSLLSARIPSLQQAVNYYLDKYGGEVFPEMGWNRLEDRERAKELFFQKQKQENEARMKAYNDHLSRLQTMPSSEGDWGVSSTSPLYIPSSPILDTSDFIEDYHSRFSPEQRLEIARKGLKLEGYDASIFTYSGSYPTLFAIDPTNQVKVVKVFKEGYQEHKEYLKEVAKQHKDYPFSQEGFANFLVMNDLFNSERIRAKN